MVEEFNGGRRVGLGGHGVDFSKFLSDLSIDERRQMDEDCNRERDVRFDAQRKAKAAKKGGKQRAE